MLLNCTDIFFPQRKDWETESFYFNRWIKIPDSQKFLPPQEGMERVKKGGFAYHTVLEIGYSYVGRHFSEREICELTEVHLVRPTLLSMCVNSNSSFVEMLKSG